MSPEAHVDLGCLRDNVREYHEKAPVPIRAHIKGHRTVEIARLQMAAGACGIAVTRVSGTSAYLDAGIGDVVVAWPWRDPALLGRFAALATRCRLSFHVDAAETIPLLGEAAARHGVTLGVRVQADAPYPMAIARLAAATPGLTLDGVTGYEPAGATRAHAERLVELAEGIRRAGLPCPVVALGGTTAADVVVPGITELGAGAYALRDAGLAALGWCALGSVAISVADPDLLEGCGQPWHPEPYVRRGGRLLPTHVCPLILRVAALRTSTGERWTVLNGADGGQG
ncbi:alanine racemase [Streptosporangiaceae bacterium NEAU-GS5]|nr:alanine racemase [Streptosporangiaceae bacterium NEAU-GS5]